jgi:signal transduction histidine kinase
MHRGALVAPSLQRSPAVPAPRASKLATFIRESIEPILVEWESFARSLPMGGAMDIATLRDHAAQMLEVIATDLETAQTRRQQSQKSKGGTDAKERDVLTAAQEHGAGRAEGGFTVGQMVAEFRALRASVVRLWSRQREEVGADDLQDLIRFNEAIDQAIAESIIRHTQEIADSKERFLAILSHDLRTPLGAIITSSSFMLDTSELREPHLTLVTRIASSARRMNQMVLDLLDFTRTRFGDGIPISRAPMDVRKLVNDVIAEVAASYPDAVLQVETKGDLHGEWDGQRLAQALTNLISNSVHHGSDKSPIRITARGEPGAVLIAVRNDGPVIPRQQLARLFEAMKESAEDRPRDRRHLGLGLYIVDKIVSAHGGSIDVESSKERGTTFTVMLPRQP